MLNVLCAAAMMMAATVGDPSVQVWHFPAGDPIHVFLFDPTTGDRFDINGVTTPGDWIRRNPDGSFSAAFTVRGEVTFDVAMIPGGPELTGDGRLVYVGDVEPHDPANPLAGVSFSDERLTIHSDASLQDAAGGPWQLTAHVVVRDGIFLLFDVDVVPE